MISSIASNNNAGDCGSRHCARWSDCGSELAATSARCRERAPGKKAAGRSHCVPSKEIKSESRRFWKSAFFCRRFLPAPPLLYKIDSTFSSLSFLALAPPPLDSKENAAFVLPLD